MRDITITDRFTNVLDLPQLYTRPSFQKLSDTLSVLKAKPPTWGSENAAEPENSQNQKSLATYLTKIISSELQWLLTDHEREIVWEQASKRLSERSGRSGMSAMTRTWKLPQTSTCDEITLDIHEPPLTEDNLGLKTWASSYLLAKRLEYMGTKYFNNSDPGRGFGIETTVLELGSGTGLVGLAAAAIWRCKVVLTDLPEIIPNLQLNASRNQELIYARCARTEVHALDWACPPSPTETGTYQIILAADPLYSPEHAPLLANVISSFLCHDESARALVMFPMRDKATVAMGVKLRTEMGNHGFQLLVQGEETGFDDWEVNGERAEVRCWWGIWGRRGKDVVVGASDEKVLSDKVSS